MTEPHSAGRFNPGASHPERARQLWQILVGMAMRRETATDGQVSRLMYDSPQQVSRLIYASPQFLSQIAGRIAFWCRDRELPLLNILVVNEITGEPSGGLRTLLIRPLSGEREKIYQVNWYEIVPPTVDELEASWHNHT